MVGRAAVDVMGESRAEQLVVQMSLLELLSLRHEESIRSGARAKN